MTDQILIFIIMVLLYKVKQFLDLQNTNNSPNKCRRLVCVRKVSLTDTEETFCISD